MNNKRRLWVLIVVLVVTILVRFFNKDRNREVDERDTKRERTGHEQTAISEDDHLIYTKHAKCRMECRNITEADIREVIREGRENAAKSNRGDRPCPTIALEDKMGDGRELRIIFARCDDGETKVVTCIDRSNDYECVCD